MTRLRESIAAPLVTLLIAQPAFGQNSLDLKEAAARDAAYKIMRAAEERFDCDFEERSMQDIGNEPGVRYLFYVNADGDECHEALIFVANRAAQDDKIVFRQVDKSSERIVGPLIYDNQVLIHEVNPEIGSNKDPEE